MLCSQQLRALHHTGTLPNIHNMTNTHVCVWMVTVQRCSSHKRATGRVNGLPKTTFESFFSRVLLHTEKDKPAIIISCCWVTVSYRMYYHFRPILEQLFNDGRELAVNFANCRLVLLHKIWNIHSNSLAPIMPSHSAVENPSTEHTQ